MFSIRTGSKFPIHISVSLLQFGVGMVPRRKQMKELSRLRGNTGGKRKGKTVTRSLPLKILSMEGRLPRWRQQGRILSISIFFIYKRVPVSGGGK